MTTTSTPDHGASASAVSTLHPTIALCADIAAPDCIRNGFHGIDIPTTPASSSMTGWVRLAAESDDEDEGYDLHRFDANWTLHWSIRISSRTPLAVVCAAIAEALAS